MGGDGLSRRDLAGAIGVVDEDARVVGVHRLGQCRAVPDEVIDALSLQRRQPAYVLADALDARNINLQLVRASKDQVLGESMSQPPADTTADWCAVPSAAQYSITARHSERERAGTPIPLGSVWNSAMASDLPGGLRPGAVSQWGLGVVICACRGGHSLRSGTDSPVPRPAITHNDGPGGGASTPEPERTGPRQLCARTAS